MACRSLAASEPAAVDEEERIARILELRRERAALDAELEELLEGLTPEGRDEVDRRSKISAQSGPSNPSAGARPAVQPPPAPVVERSPAEPDAVSEVVAEDPRCGTLDVLDSNRDGEISGSDRYWRYLGLWKDDGDGRVEDDEVRSLYRHDIRRVSSRLYSYTTAKDVDRGIWIEESIRFDLAGQRQRAVLVIDAGRLARGGDLRLEDSDGVSLEGIEALRAGLEWVLGDGRRVAVLCSRATAG